MGEPRSRPEPSVTREAVRGLGEVAQRSPEVQQVLGGLLLLVLMVVFVPAGLLYLLAMGLLYAFLLGVLLPAGAGPIPGFIAAAYWIGALIGMFFFFRAIYRRLARRSRVLQGATAVAFGGRRLGDEDESAIVVWAVPTSANAAPPVQTPSLAELDARLAAADAPLAPADGPLAPGEARAGEAN